MIRKLMHADIYIYIFVHKQEDTQYLVAFISSETCTSIGGHTTIHAYMKVKFMSTWKLHTCSIHAGILSVYESQT